MSVYPFALDSDETIIRIDDNITELGGDAINQLRDAIFAMQGELGIGLKGSLNNLADRLNVSLNSNGTIKQSALAAIGLVTLPIVDNQIANNAGIKEYKLALDHTTSDLYTLIVANKDLLDAVNAFASTTSTNFLNHLAGSTFLSDGETSARHVASHIDLNSVPSDPRDPFFTWSGLRDKTGTLRTASQVATALLQINTDLTNHENSTADAHVAEAISVDTSEFQEIPATANTVQKVIDYIERAEELNIGEHRAVQHANGIPAVARSQSMTEIDGYGRDVVVPTTTVNAYLVNPPANTPVDSNTVGDDIVKFKPSNSDFIFDSQFSQVRIGDILRINYGNSISTSFEIESIRFTPGVEWIVRINGTNLSNAVDGYIDGYAGVASARIDRAQYDSNTSGVLALASANSIPSTLYPNILGSVIAGNPRGATALGLGFDGNKLNSSHYKLWLQLYPTGNPAENVVNLPFIDVTGDAGVSPGSYTLEKVVHATNDAFRKIGYNYRFIAFEHKGDFGIMLADAIGKVSFAIINGNNALGTVITDTYTQNVVADASDGDGLDAFGFGSGAAEIASPAYQATWIDSTAAQYPTKVITPVKRRFYIVDGRKLDAFAPTYLANSDGYWPATIEAKVSTGSSVEVTYKVNLNLCAAKLKPGKTLVIQPEVALDSTSYLVNDYGRFIIKQVNFSEPCGAVGAFTDITVINGVHANGNGIALTSDPGLPVRIFFAEDSIGFDDLHVIDGGVTGINYHRFHEIYVTRNGTTFSHERARMKAAQAEASPPTSLLRSDFWHIKEVSPKLRGYRDNLTTFNKYVRFYVTRYDATSGEFDGYIGRRNSLNASISNTGPLTTSRKNVRTRFFDETYVDYIDLEFKELAVGPTGTAILSDANPRYVDIEIFPTMRLNVENMLIGSCEVNWDPPTNQNIIQSVKDLRDFGSIGPNDLNNSAVDFISAGDRLLHENGVIRGFQYIPSGTTNTTGKLFFNGGVALVNGNIVTTNNSSIIIPAISDGGATSVTVTWAICVNEFGYLQPIILTNVKDQIFAAVGSLYYIPSVTFDELLNRKDLTLIATVDAHIASITINDSDVHDFRRFVANEGANHPLVLTQDESTGNFHSFEAVKQWINRKNSSNNRVKVRGAWYVTSTIDLTDFSNSVIFEGDQADFIVTSAKGIKVGSNVILRNLSFSYDPPTQTPASGDLVLSGNGCIYGITTDSSNITDLTIENCVFVGNNSDPKAPFINIEINRNHILSNLKIVDNTFDDLIDNNAAIAIISLNNGVSSNPAIVSDCLISRNIAKKEQGIILSANIVGRPGISVSNVVISNNQCSYIGYWVTSVPHTVISTNPSNGLLITQNTCHYIHTAKGNGQSFLSVTLSSYLFGFGSVIIEKNFCNWIHVCSQDGTNLGGSNVEFSSMQILSNVLTAYDYTGWFEPLFNGVGNDISNMAIIVQGFPKASASDVTTVQILNNNTNYGTYDGTTYTYVSGIYALVSADIQGNTIKGFKKDGTIDPFRDGFGILAASHYGSPGNAVRNYSIVHNRIYRGAETITAYVGAGSVLSTNLAVIQHNFFDSSTIDGASTAIFSAFPPSWIANAFNNKNQTVVQSLNARCGNWDVDDIIAGSVGSGSTIQSNSTFLTVYSYQDTGNAEAAEWRIPLLGLIPTGVTVTGFTIKASLTPLPATTKHIVVNLVTPDAGNEVIIASTALTSTPTVYTATIAQTHIVYPLGSTSNIPELIITLTVNHGSGVVVTIQDFAITYRW